MGAANHGFAAIAAAHVVAANGMRHGGGASVDPDEFVRAMGIGLASGVAVMAIAFGSFAWWDSRAQDAAVAAACVDGRFTDQGRLRAALRDVDTDAASATAVARHLDGACPDRGGLVLHEWSSKGRAGFAVCVIRPDAATADRDAAAIAAMVAAHRESVDGYQARDGRIGRSFNVPADGRFLAIVQVEASTTARDTHVVDLAETAPTVVRP